MEKKKTSKNEEVHSSLLVLDASNTVLGRLASHAAKQALLGKKVVIVNCPEALISGSKNNVLKEYKEARQRGGSSLNGPNFPKQSFRIVKRTVRGMLNFRYGRGKDAFKRVICYDDCPEEYQSLKTSIESREMKTNTMKLRRISNLI